MRIQYSAVFVIIIIALIVCMILAKRSNKSIRNSVGLLEAALIPPIIGNLLIMLSQSRDISLVGHYINYIGMDLVMFAIVNFTNNYCKGIGKGDGSQKPTVMYLLLALDAVQMLLNPFFGHAFRIEAVDLEDSIYYKVVPMWGQIVHWVIDYFVFACAILIFVIAATKTVKIYREKYSVILLTLIMVGVMQTYFILSRSPIDRSMIGYGFFGVIIYYFAIKYRPLRLLDQMLSNIVSDLKDAFYIFDPDGNCIWANREGLILVKENGDKYENVVAGLKGLFGDIHNKEGAYKQSIGEGDNIRYFELEENQVIDEDGAMAGSYLRILDITDEERELKMRDEEIGKISREVYRDALTGVGNKASYNARVKKLNKEIEEGLSDFAVAMVDMNNLKRINDEYGHKSGDIFIKGCCHMICETFKHSPVFRIGGDEFAVIMTGEDYVRRNELVQELRDAFVATYEKTDSEPWEKYSAAVGMAERAMDDNSYELVFKRADALMYDDKRAFKERCGSYR